MNEAYRCPRAKTMKAEDRVLVDRSISSRIATITFEIIVFSIAAWFVAGATIDWLLP
jgi:hypothetical protein